MRTAALAATARKRAVDDAMAQAQHLARAVKAEIGDVVHLRVARADAFAWDDHEMKDKGVGGLASSRERASGGLETPGTRARTIEVAMTVQLR